MPEIQRTTFNKIEGYARIVKYAGDPSAIIGLYAGASTGCLLIDTLNAKLYINTGTPSVPVWTLVGSQT